MEPVFANLRHNTRLDRFTLRERAKVDGQWKRYCLVHNIETLGAVHHANTACERAGDHAEYSTDAD